VKILMQKIFGGVGVIICNSAPGCPPFGYWG
jgi:hypothetical protein